VSADDLLAKLARLDSSDRAWLLGELPPSLRRDLADMLAEDTGQPAPVPVPSAPRPAGWEGLDPQLVAQSVEAEPAWLVSAATRDAPLAWRLKLLQSMSARRRHDIEVEDRAGRTLGSRAATLVQEGCRERLAQGNDSLHRDEPKSRFAALVEQMRSRFA
jgi:hypothetical protein